MLFKRLLTQNIGKRILVSFFLFSFFLTAISIAVILYSQYTKEKDDVITTTTALLEARVEFISEVLWNFDKPLADLSIKSLLDNSNISYIAIYNENKKIFTTVGNKSTSFSKNVEIPLYHKDQHSDFKNYVVGTLVANISTATAEQHVKDNLVNIVLIQTFKSIITSFVFLFLIYTILIKHLNKITRGIITSSNDEINTNELISLERTPRNDELQLLADTLNENQLARNEHLRILNVGKNKLLKEVEIRKVAEKEALDAHEELLYVLNSLPAAVYFCKSDGEVMFMNHNALQLLSEHDSIISSTKKQQFLNNIVKFNKENTINSESLDIALQANCSEFVSKMNAYCVSNDGEGLLTPVELTLIPAKQNSKLREPNFIAVVKDKSEEAMLKKMDYIASHDYLTQIHNRMYLSEQLEKVLSEGSGDYSLAIIDLDNFKRVNDTSGYRAGDQLLRLVAEIIPKSLSHNDLFARIGGVKFAVLFNLDPEDSVQKSFKLIADIEGLNFSFNDDLLPISCSIGITELRNRDKNIEVVIARAEKACYQAKRNGEGSVLISEDIVADSLQAEMAAC